MISIRRFFSLGFTFLEVLIALAVISVGLLALAQLQNQNMHFMQEIKQETEIILKKYNEFEKR